MLKLKGYYQKKDEFVGYKVKNLKQLKEMGYILPPEREKIFMKARKGNKVVYISREDFESGEQRPFLFNHQGVIIAICEKTEEKIKVSKLKLCYLKKDELVGYKVKNLKELKKMGFKLPLGGEEIFMEAREDNKIVYIDRSAFDSGDKSPFLFDYRGMIIAICEKIK
jgi:hypothetical protein